MLSNAARAGNRVAWVRYWISMGHGNTTVVAKWGRLLEAEARVLAELADMLAEERRGPTPNFMDGLTHR